MVIRGGSTPRSNSLPFYIPFFTEKVLGKGTRYSEKVLGPFRIPGFVFLLKNGTPFTYLVYN